MTEKFHSSTGFLFSPPTLITKHRRFVCCSDNFEWNFLTVRAFNYESAQMGLFTENKGISLPLTATTSERQTLKFIQSSCVNRRDSLALQAGQSCHGFGPLN